MIYFCCISLFGIFFAAIAQVLLKVAAKKDYKNIFKEYFNIWVILGYIIMLLTTLISMYAYKGIPVSMGMAFEATSYIYIAIFNKYIFGEDLSCKKIFAIILIILGIIIFSI